MTERDTNAPPAPVRLDPARVSGSRPRRLPWPVRLLLVAALGAAVAALASYALRSIGY